MPNDRPSAGIVRAGSSGSWVAAEEEARHTNTPTDNGSGARSAAGGATPPQVWAVCSEALSVTRSSAATAVRDKQGPLSNSWQADPAAGCMHAFRASRACQLTLHRQESQQNSPCHMEALATSAQTLLRWVRQAQASDSRAAPAAAPLHTLDEWVRAGNATLALSAARGSSGSDEAAFVDMPQQEQEQPALLPPGAGHVPSSRYSRPGLMCSACSDKPAVYCSALVQLG